MPTNAVSLPFKEQAEFFRRKINLPTESWTDIYTQEHDWAFVVAGANRDAIVGDFRTAVEKVIAEGGTLEQFRKDFDEIVARHGWSYNGGRNWRSRVIYDTNLNSSYQAGRYQQLLAVKDDRPYWMYVHNDAVTHPRPLHQSWNKLILRWDNPWWKTHFPTNGWGCQCRVVALSESDLKRMGRTVDEAPETVYEQREIGARSPLGPRTVRVPEGVDPGFEYTPGRSRLESATPPPAPVSAPLDAGVPNRIPQSELPKPQEIARNSMPANSVDGFLREFGATDKPAIFTDAAGEYMVIGEAMFKGVDPQSLDLLATALKKPDEIWARLEWVPAVQKAVVRRRYLMRVSLADKSEPVQVAFETGTSGWLGATSETTPGLDIESLRTGVRLYRRK